MSATDLRMLVVMMADEGDPVWDKPRTAAQLPLLMMREIEKHKNWDPKMTIGIKFVKCKSKSMARVHALVSRSFQPLLAR